MYVTRQNIKKMSDIRSRSSVGNLGTGLGAMATHDEPILFIATGCRPTVRISSYLIGPHRTQLEVGVFLLGNYRYLKIHLAQ